MPSGSDTHTEGEELAELAKRAGAGDREALASLVGRARSKGARAAQGRLVTVVRPGIQEHIRKYLAQRCGASVVAAWLEDLTQDAVVRVLLGLPALRGEFWPWALAIARNTACERVRAEVGLRRLREALRCLRGDAGELTDPREEGAAVREQEALSAQLRRACEMVLSELEGDQRRAFVLRLEGAAPKEIAKALQVNAQSVYNWKHRHQSMVVARYEELCRKDGAQ